MVHTETDMARFDWLLFKDKYLRVKSNKALIYPKSYIACRDSFLMGI